MVRDSGRGQASEQWDSKSRINDAPYSSDEDDDDPYLSPDHDDDGDDGDYESLPSFILIFGE